MGKIINNIKLVIKYPFLLPRNRWTGKVIVWDWIWQNLKHMRIEFALSGFYHFEYTELDSLPEGWRKVFGEQMCEDIKQALLKSGGKKALKEWRIMDIKEKWGYLHLYSNWETKELSKVIEYYEELSKQYCIYCGKPTKYITRSWINYVCEDCFINKKLKGEKIK